MTEPVTSKYSRYFYIIILFFIAFGACYVVLTPPFESPDEFLHLDYINYICKYKELPNQYTDYKNPERFVGQGHQHPLYYVLASLPVYLFTTNGCIEYNHPSGFNKDWKGGTADNNIYGNVFTSQGDKTLFYFLRFLSLLFSAINLYFIYRISLLFFKNTYACLLPVIIAASLPQFQFISGVMNNDSLSNMFATGAIYYLLLVINNPENVKPYLKAAVFAGLGILSKKTAVFILPCALVLMAFVVYKKDKNTSRAIYKNSAYFLIIVLVVSSFVFVRNYILYGEFLAGSMERNTMPQFVELKSLFSYYFVQPFTTGMLNSFIGVFGWMNIPVPKYIEAVYLALLVPGFAVSFYLLKKLKDLKLFFLYLTFASCLAGVIYFNLTFTQYQGRYMFPVLAAVSVIAAAGNQYLFSFIKNLSLRKAVIISGVSVLFIFDIISILMLYTHYN